MATLHSGQLQFGGGAAKKRVQREAGKLYQDPLYGAKVLTPLAVAVMDTPEFQRLAGLKQLGFAEVTYRGAHHTRLEHSVGTYFITRTIMRRIVQNHERLELDHPGDGEFLSDRFRMVPQGVKSLQGVCSEQSRWRGLTELLSVSALLHDIGHVPFGHTLEDEFSGLFRRHDSVGGVRLYEMLFSGASELAAVFDKDEPWVGEIPNERLRRLIYVVLSWKEHIEPPYGFETVLEKEIGKVDPDGLAGIRKALDDALQERLATAHSDQIARLRQSLDEVLGRLSANGEGGRSQLSELVGRTIDKEISATDQSQASALKKTLDEILDNRGAGIDQERMTRLKNLQRWYLEFREEKLFHPFMSDVIGNTICADLLDYLPRDRKNLGMEPRFHTRLQRYFTIAPGTLYEGEGRRVVISVTRKGHGGQRRDVATAVLDIMRERYEMAERVYYHHKKAAASSLLAKLMELLPDAVRPHDRQDVYPAPWQDGYKNPPHMLHLSDSGLIDYVGTVAGATDPALQKRLYDGLRFRRKELYRTLMVIDCDVANQSWHSVGYFAESLRGPEDNSKSDGRRALERKLEAAADCRSGDVIIYCPAPTMQSKEVDARLEIFEGRVLPLRVQRESFAYDNDLKVLQQYYQQLWRAYVFVSPEVFRDGSKCRAIVDAFCYEYHIEKPLAYRKVRGWEFEIDHGVTTGALLAIIDDFFARTFPHPLVPAYLVTKLCSDAMADDELLRLISAGSDATPRLTALFSIVMVSKLVGDGERKLTKRQATSAESYCSALRKGQVSAALKTAAQHGDFESYKNEVIETALKFSPQSS